MTTFTEPKSCERDTGLLARHCYCEACEDLREEFLDLHRDLGKAYLEAKSEPERIAHMASIANNIERYKKWL